MKQLAILPLIALTLACASPRAGQTRASSTPGHGAIKLTVNPNPVVAKSVSGNTYDFPFDVVVKETGGHPVTITRVSANVYAGGGIPVATESYDAARIAQLGFATTIQANGEIHYHFAPRKDVPDERLFSTVYGDVRVEALDDAGTPASTTTTIRVTR
jgi:hypothetical protein